MAVLGEPIDEGGGQMVVFEKGAPFGKAQVGGDEGGLFLVPLMHQGKEEADLNRLDLNIANFVDRQTFRRRRYFLRTLVSEWSATER